MFFLKLSILYTKLDLYYRFIYESTTPWLHATTDSEVIASGLRTADDTSFGVTGMYVFLLNLFFILIYIYYRCIYKFTMPWLHVTTEVTGSRTADWAQMTCRYFFIIYSLY
jgi:hypothetical protein